MSKVMRRAWVSLIMLCSQKKEQTRAPRVTGVTMCRLVDGIKDQMARRQLDPVRAVIIVDHQFAAVIFLGLRKEQRDGKIGADAQAGQMVAPDAIVDMLAEELSRDDSG